MFGYIKGRVFECFENTVILENNGVGFELTVSAATLVRIAEAAGGDIKIYTYMSVRDDGVSLFGFYSREEKNMFDKLISISGVGPKVAISVLSGMKLDDLIVAIISSDVKSLSKLKGIGKKTAERIILELRENLEYMPSIDAPAVLNGISPVSRDEENAILALKGLGINQSEAASAVKRAAVSAKTLEELITLALRNLN